MNNKGADQTARMRRLVCGFVVCKPPKTGFSCVAAQMGSYKRLKTQNVSHVIRNANTSLNMKILIEKSYSILSSISMYSLLRLNAFF